MNNSISSLLIILIGIVNALIPLVIALAVLHFLFNLAKYGLSKSPTERKETHGIIINGIIILFVMVSVWGLVNLISYSLKLEIDSFNNNISPASIIPSSLMRYIKY